jgi:hypothetical protein
MPFSLTPLLCRLLLMMAFVLSVHGEPETDKEKEKKPPRTIRFLPLGESPPFRQEIRDGVRYELEPPVGSIPPREVSLTVGKLVVPSVNLSLGRISLAAGLPNGVEPIAVRRPEDSPTAQPWMNLTLPETGNVLVLVWRDPGKLWDKPRWLLQSDGPEFNAGKLRLSNLSPVEIRFIIGEEKIALTPGKVHLIALPVGRDVPVQIAWIDASGNANRIYSSAIVQNQGERGELMVYRADGEQPRQPLKVLPLREKAPEPIIEKR